MNVLLMLMQFHGSFLNRLPRMKKGIMINTKEKWRTLPSTTVP